MEITNLLKITTKNELINWLEIHSDSEQFCWIITSIKHEEGKIQYLDAVEAALCFGWIDGIKKKLSPTQTAQRISPRRKNSSWTELNKERVRRLKKLGMMRKSGLEMLPEMNPSLFKIDKRIQDTINKSYDRKRYFDNLPDLYKRVRIDNIQNSRKNIDVYEKRLNKFIDSLDNKKIYGQWNDEGRLLNY